MKKIFLLSFFTILIVEIFAQQLNQKYWVFFTDKSHSDYSIEDPSAFLSQASLLRREKMDIQINYYDLPVSGFYINQIKALDVKFVVESRWLNAISIQVEDETILETISSLPFVQSINKVKRHAIIDGEGIPLENNMVFRSENFTASDYGGAFNQIRMIDVDFLHNLGFRGQGIKIAVLDGGFDGVDNGAGFISLRNKDQIIETKNFPDNNNEVYFSSTHGSNVLSIMAVDDPGNYIGSAPDASYYLFRTEVVDSERVVEEDYWMEAAEYADFVGADIINSSLGYTTFDVETEDHTYADLDGNTTVVTIAADRAAAAGILVVNSAGNEGDNEWRFISAPADGDSVFTIGAVDINGNYVAFSSHGPTADGRIKPNVAGQGAGTAVVNEFGVVGYGNGTSYSSPLIAGACASFMSAFPELSNMDVINIIQNTASQSDDPDFEIGYGIPNFAKAYLQLKEIALSTTNIISILPNPATDNVTIYIHAQETTEATVLIHDITGNLVYATTLNLWDDKIAPIYIDNLNALAAGMYTVQLIGDVYSETQKMMIR